MNGHEHWYGRRRVVVRKGHQGYAFYFIFSGAACVTLDEDEETAFTKKEIVALKKGVCFGEIALIKDAPRMATVVCIEDTEFLVVDKDDFFNNGLHQHIQREFQYRLQFFKGLSVFSSLPEDTMESISDIGKIEEYSHGSVVVRDSTDTQWLLFITKGRCDVLRLVDLAKLYSDRIRERAEKVKRVTCEPSRSKLLRGDYPLSLLPQGQRSPFPWMVPTNLPVKSATNKQHAREDGDAATGKSSRRGEITPATEFVDDFLPAGLRQQLNDEYSKTRKKLTDASTDKFTERLTLGGGTITVPGVEAGVYIRIDSLGPGQCFGIESVVSGEMPRLSLLSQGCEVIRVPCSKLRECANEATLGMLQGIIPDYPDNQFLWESYRVQSTWGAFKQRALREVVENHAQAVTPHTFAKSLRFGPRPAQRGTRRETVIRGTKEPVHLPKINLKTSLSSGEAITATGIGEADQVISSDALPGTLRKRGAGTPRPKTAIGRRTRADDETFPIVPVSQDLVSERQLGTPFSVPNRPQSVQYVSASRPPRPILSKRPATSVKKQRKRLVDLKI